MMNINAFFKALKLRKIATLLLILQLALTLALLINSLVLSIDAFDKLNQSVKYDLNNLIAVELIPTSTEYKNTAYYKSIMKQDLKKLSELDAVNHVAQYQQLPIQMRGWNGTFKDLSGETESVDYSDIHYVPNYFSSEQSLSTLGLKIIAGRALTAEDEIEFQGFDHNNTPNIVITESLAKAVYPNDNALGKLTSNGTIVGISEDFATNPKQQGRSKYFAVFSHILFTEVTSPQNYLIRVQPGQLDTVIKQIQTTILSVQVDRDIIRVYKMKERYQAFFKTEIGLAKLFMILSLLMILVTVISCFSHAHFHISQQVKFIGIRRALGATKKDILLYVLTENWLLTFLGCVLGIVTTLLTNILLSQIITINKPELLLYLLAIVVIFVSATLAAILPAYKTTKIPPVLATQTR
ncbi:MAG: FtsX-like permease family protein [Psychromonas sp.]|nr:FtsX-like permease family protein [Psychromonas sp.]